MQWSCTQYTDSLTPVEIEMQSDVEKKDNHLQAMCRVRCPRMTRAKMQNTAG
jgi:hypothetical protein